MIPKIVETMIRMIREADTENAVLRSKIKHQERDLCALEARVDQLTKTLKGIIE